MSEGTEVVPEANGKEGKEENTNGKDSAVEESNMDEANQKEDAEEISPLDAAIIRQVEYYFGDVNLPRDKFLRHQTELDNGWVPLNILIRFNRLSKLSPDIDVIENALKKSTSNLLEVLDKKVRRNPNQPVPAMDETRRKAIMERTVYLKGFPKDASLDDILNFFKQFDEVENVIMRRYLDHNTNSRQFKGSIFATFKTKEQADKFVEMKESLSYNDVKLIVMRQYEYGAMKQEEKQDRGKKKEKIPKIEGKKHLQQLPRGTVLHFEDGFEKMTREEIKTALNTIDKKFDVAFIDFKIGLTKGWIRFSQENAAVDFYKLLNDGVITIGEHKVTLKILEGDEEKEYLTKTLTEMSKRRKSAKQMKNKGRNTHKGKYMKRKRDNDGERGPPAKVKCNS